MPRVSYILIVVTPLQPRGMLAEHFVDGNVCSSDTARAAGCCDSFNLCTFVYFLHHFTGAAFPVTHAPRSLRDKSRTLQQQILRQQKYAPTCRIPQKHQTFRSLQSSSQRGLFDSELLTSHKLSSV